MEKYLFDIITCLLLSACSVGSKPVIQSYEISEGEQEVLVAADMMNDYAFDLTLNKDESHYSLTYWIERYEQGEKVESVQKQMDLEGQGGKVRLHFLEKNTEDRILYHVSDAMEGQQGLRKEEISHPDPDLGGSSLTVEKIPIKENKPQVIALRTFHKGSPPAPLTQAMFESEQELAKVLQHDHVIVFKVELET